jgi:hypothetical protein
MYSVPFKTGKLEGLACWGYQGGPDVEDLPETVDDLCPYPGYAGEVSEKAIENGWAKPAVPMEMHHS